MKLYVYEHCPYCVRARMIFGVKNIDFELGIIMEADIETPTKMIGKKMVPILQKDDGSYMGESLDIVHYVDHLDKPILTADADNKISQWEQEYGSVIFKLAVPRFTKADFKELETAEAREYFRAREEKAFGDLEALINMSDDFIQQLEPGLDVLAPLVRERARSDFEISDITLWPILYSLSIVKGVNFPQDVKDYMERVSGISNVPLLFDKAI